MELYKLKDKYEKLGFKFIIESRRDQYVFDAFAPKKETGEKIVFEIKSIDSLSKTEQLNLFKEKRALVKELYGEDVKYKLVLAQEDRQSEVIESEALNILLIRFIGERELATLRAYIPQIRDLFSVEKLTVDKFDFGDFRQIKIEGTANLLFFEQFDEINFQGTRLTDGVTFEFKITLTYNVGGEYIYQIADNSTIKFYFEEFTRYTPPSK